MYTWEYFFLLGRHLLFNCALAPFGEETNIGLVLYITFVTAVTTYFYTARHSRHEPGRVHQYCQFDDTDLNANSNEKIAEPPEPQKKKIRFRYKYDFLDIPASELPSTGLESLTDLAANPSSTSTASISLLHNEYSAITDPKDRERYINKLIALEPSEFVSMMRADMVRQDLRPGRNVDLATLSRDIVERRLPQAELKEKLEAVRKSIACSDTQRRVMQYIWPHRVTDSLLDLVSSVIVEMDNNEIPMNPHYPILLFDSGQF